MIDYNRLLQKLEDSIFVLQDQIETHEKFGLQNGCGVLLLRGQFIALKEFRDWISTEFKQEKPDNTKA